MEVLARKYNVTHIICSKDALSRLNLWQYDFSDQVKLAETEKYIAYKVIFSWRWKIAKSLWLLHTYKVPWFVN